MPIDDSQAKNIKEQILKQLETQAQIPADKKEQLRKYISSLNNEQLEEFLIKNNMMGSETNPEDSSEEQGQDKKTTQKPGSGDCIMCLISSKKIESLAIYDDKDYLAVLEINPFTLGHTILIPKKHLKETKNLQSKAFTIANKIGRHLLKKLKKENVENFQVNSSNETGHALINIIPTYKDQPLDYKRKPSDKKALQELAMKIGLLEAKKAVKPAIKKEKKSKESSEEQKKANIIKLPRRIP